MDCAKRVNRFIALKAIADYLTFGILRVTRQPLMRSGGNFLVKGTSATVQKNMVLLYNRRSQSNDELAA